MSITLAGELAVEASAGPAGAPTLDRWYSEKRLGGLSRFAFAITVLNILGHAFLGFEQSFDLAEACVRWGTWGGVVECFGLVMALAGLRPGEAAGLLWEDVELPGGDGAGWLHSLAAQKANP